MKIRKSVSLAPLSTFRIGGKAEYFCCAKTPQELLRAVKWAEDHKKSYRIFAGGSNIVFPDKKIVDLLIQIKGGAIHANGGIILADAGVALADVIKRSVGLGLSGLETLSGIPGTLGGAIYGNAGAYGHSIAEVVQKVEILDGRKIRWLKNRDCRFGYRESVFKKKSYLILRAVLKFKKGDKKKLRQISREIISIRLKKYEPRLRCPGSFFKNVLVEDVPKKDLAKVDNSKIIEGKIPAGYLLEEIGAKGMRFGDIKIADFHGNLLINQGRATARDVRRLARILKKRVKRRFGIELEEEVRYF